MSAHIMPITTSQPSPTEVAGRRAWFGARGDDSDDRGWLHTAKVLGGVVAAATPIILLAAQLGNWGDDDKADPQSGRGSISMVAPSLDASKITVAGTADPGVDAVVVRIDSLGTDGRRWAEEAEVFAQEWKTVIPTEPKLVGEYRIKAWYHTPSGVELAANQRRLVSAFVQTPPPPTLPSDIAECVVEYGDACFQGQPGWSDPSVYRSDQ